MREHFQLQDLSPAEASAALAAIAEQLGAGTLVISGTPVGIAGPATVTVDVDATRAVAHLAVTVHCHRPEGVSRLLQEELARPGG